MILHKFFIFIYTVFFAVLFNKRVKKRFLIQKNDGIIINVLVLCILLPAAHKQRGAGGQGQVVNFEKALFHSVTPTNSGFP